jgi:hypothetical protein
MKLTVIAAQERLAPPRADGYVVRLDGLQASEDQAPPGFQQAADRAMELVRATFPGWLWQWARDSGVLALGTFEGPISWWWYTPLSEMSPMRSPLLRELYWLALLRVLLEDRQIDRVAWYGGDVELARVAASVAARAGVRFEANTAALPLQRRSWVAVARRIRSSLTQACLCATLRVIGFGSVRAEGVRAVLYSRFPVLWETHATSWRERMFGDWPDALERRGFSVLYAAVCTASIRQILTSARRWLERCACQRVILIEALVAPRDFLRAHADLGFAIRFWWWRRARRQDPVVFDGSDVSHLFWREVDANAMSPEVPYNATLASGMRRLLALLPDARVVCLPFEYQPMERAVWTGAQHSTPRAVVGLQTGVYTSNQMGFAFPREQVRIDRSDPLRSPLPDVLAAYGELPYRIFAERLGADRVCLSGPVRYPTLATPIDFDRTEFCATHDLPTAATFVLVTTSTVRAESLPMLEGAFMAAAALQDMFLLVKFHYHLTLHDEVGRLARRYGVRYHVFDANLDELMMLAVATVCGGSSIGIEAIVRGCMPVVFRSARQLVANPMMEVPSAVFFWQTADDLATALVSILRRDDAYSRRRCAWTEAVRAHLWPLDGQADARLFDFLRAHGHLEASAARS